MKTTKALVWFRNDLRLRDNPALAAACKHSELLLIYILEEHEAWPLGGASRWWLHHSLSALQKDLSAKDQILFLYRGQALELLPKIVKKHDISHVYWNRRYIKHETDTDSVLKSMFKTQDIECQSFKGNLLNEPWEVLKKDRTPYQVYTPYWRAKLTVPDAFDLSVLPRAFPKKVCVKDSSAVSLNNCNLLPQIPWDSDMREFWQPGETSALKRLKTTLKEIVLGYNDNRNLPDIDGTSRLSPFLHFGEISVQRIWTEVVAIYGPASRLRNEHVEQFLKELVWREFAAHLLFHFPQTDHLPLRDKFLKFPWEDRPKEFKAWTKGMTGFPVIDAGMRQLWRYGWMHNRVRMIVGSFLVKDLRVHWLEGAKWFWDTLVDADLASNSMGWQWVAGSGADAAPYFRVFNPTLQSKKFDPKGAYIREFVPELKMMPDAWIHEPWEAPADVLKKAGIVLGVDYPKPVVDHFEEKLIALKAYDRLKDT